MIWLGWLGSNLFQKRYLCLVCNFSHFLHHHLLSCVSMPNLDRQRSSTALWQGHSDSEHAIIYLSDGTVEALTYDPTNLQITQSETPVRPHTILHHNLTHTKCSKTWDNLNKDTIEKKPLYKGHTLRSLLYYTVLAALTGYSLHCDQRQELILFSMTSNSPCAIHTYALHVDILYYYNRVDDLQHRRDSDAG